MRADTPSQGAPPPEWGKGLPTDTSGERHRLSSVHRAAVPSCPGSGRLSLDAQRMAATGPLRALLQHNQPGTSKHPSLPAHIQPHTALSDLILEASAPFPPVLPGDSTSVDSPSSSESQSGCRFLQAGRAPTRSPIGYSFLILCLYIAFLQYFCARHQKKKKRVRKMKRSSQFSRRNQPGNE